MTTTQTCFYDLAEEVTDRMFMVNETIVELVHHAIPTISSDKFTHLHKCLIKKVYSPTLTSELTQLLAYLRTIQVRH